VLSAAGSEPRVVITDKLASSPPALRRVLPKTEHRRHKGLNNRAENSHQPTRQRERAMRRFKSPEHAQLMGSDPTTAAVQLLVADRDGSNPRTTWQSPMSGMPVAVTFAPDGAEVAIEILQPTQSGGGIIWVVGSDGNN